MSYGNSNWSVSIDPHYSNRSGLASLCNSLGLLGTFAEIGVHKGAFAEAFLEDWQGQQYDAVDHYMPMNPGDDKGDYAGDREEHRVLAELKLNRFHHVHIEKHYISGEEYFKQLKGKAYQPKYPICGFYLDANHGKRDTISMIGEAYNAVIQGGVVAGHDYCNQFPGVMDAVNLFAAWYGLHVKLIAQRNDNWSWYFIKPRT